MVLNRNKKKKLAQTNNTVKYERAYEVDRICINGSYKTNLDLELKELLESLYESNSSVVKRIRLKLKAIIDIL